MPKPQKIAAVEDLKERFSKAKSIIVTDYRGLTVAQMTDLRSRLRKEGIQYKVAKNRLAKRALSECGLDTMDGFLKGTTAIALGINDPVAPAKVLAAYAKDNDKLKLVGGQMDNRLLDIREIMELSKLPSRDVLLGRFVGSLASPVQKLAFGLNQVVGKLVYAFDAVSRLKAGQ